MEKKFDKPIVLDERYFGETPAIKNLFNLFCKFRDKYTNSLIKMSGSINGDRDLQTFLDACANLWGFASCSMIIKNANVFQFSTFCVDSRLDVLSDKEELVEYGPNGIKFKEKYKIHLLTIGYTGLLMDSKYTNREVFGVFLHEVGHNFQSAMNGKLASFNTINMIIKLYFLFFQMMNDPVSGLQTAGSYIAASNTVIGIGSTAYRALVNTQVGRTLANAISIFDGMKDNIVYAFAFLLKPVTMPVQAFASIMTGISQLLFATLFIKSYSDEQLADSFAADLGFGKDLISAFMKLEKFGQPLDIINRIPILNAIVDLWCLPFKLIINAFDEHPTTGARVKGTLDIMKSDLNNGFVDPRMRKALEKDIKDIEKTMADFKSELDAAPFQYRQAFSSCIAHFYANELNGGAKYQFLKPTLDHSRQKEIAYNKSRTLNRTLKEDCSFLDDVVIK